ncbi:FAD-dependent oxidoreductase [Adlercreutzia sp. ZJ154]|uniref:FAD-dependent oxidoreductase n=1 Tax=Adlercreutzia sp. ZJ154 TaxID=2709790 RepID=UPI0013EA1EC5|nr:FAD-dependent oxidoreductase [Adlercreutzia sp. ZJ154]
MEFDVEYDVVVLGSGASGKSAAYTVASESDLSVAILEKREVTGGTSVFAEGHAASESSEAKARKVPDYPGELPEGAHFPTCEEHAKRYLEFSHYRANPDVVKAFVYNSAETIDILKSLGVEYTDVSIYAYDQPNELYTFHRPDGLGARVQELLLRACENAGVDIFTKTPGKELIIEDGKVVGVIAEDADGELLHIGAKAVIIATGGFGNNPDMVREYSWTPHLPDFWYCPMTFENTGDGVNMALAAGGDTRNIGTMIIGNCAWGKTPDSHLNGGGCQPVLWVDTTGKRFANEGLAANNIYFPNTIAQRDDGIIYVLMDSDCLQYYMEVGSDIGLGDFVHYHTPLSRLKTEIEESVNSNDGAAFSADSIEELAEKLNIDPHTLKETVDIYNGYCDEGYDGDFYKLSKFLYPVRTAPFYAIRQGVGPLVTCGGIRVNGDFQVVNEKSEAIPGLYAVGNDASGLYGDTYNMDCPGSANGFAHTSGRLAARHAISQIGA